MRKKLSMFLLFALTFGLLPNHPVGYAESDLAIGDSNTELSRTEIVYLCSQEDFYYEDEYVGSTIYEYDEWGNLTKRIIQDSDLSQFVEMSCDYFYGLNNQIKSSFCEYYEDNTYEGVISNYDDYEQLKSVKYYDENYDLYKLVEYDYDAHSHLISYQVISRDNMKTYDKELYYDEYGRRVFDGYATYDYDDAGGLIKKTDNSGRIYEYKYDSLGNCIRVDERVNKKTTKIVAYTENEYDERGNMTSSYYYENDELVRFTKTEYNADNTIHEQTSSVASRNDAGKYEFVGELKTIFTYDDNKNILSKKSAIYYYGYPEGVNYESYIYEYTTRELPVSNNGIGNVNYRDYYDYLLCEGRDGFMLVAKWNETVKDAYYEVGVLDRDYNWVVPLTRETILAERLTEFGPEDIGEIYYAGEGVFLYNHHEYGWNDYAMLNVYSREWTDIGYYVFEKPIKFHEGYLIAKTGNKHGNNYAVIINPSGNVLETDIIAGVTRHSGGYANDISRFSEGMFFARDGFYDGKGNKVIDLSEYADQIINEPFFVDGKAVLVAINSAWTEYEAVIDRDGTFISEFTKR